MKPTTRVGFLAGAAALALTGVSFAGPATEATTEELAQRLAAAEAKIAAMEAAENPSWLTEQRAAEIRGLVQDVLADADTRASLLQAGMTSGYDNGFIIGSSDGNWLIRTNFLMQQRFIYNDQDTPPAGTDDDTYGFENTRSKFIISGHVVNPDWYYMLSINLAANGNIREGIGNAYLGHDYGNGWKVQMGTMKAPLLREELVEPQYQLAVERSNLNYLFTGGYADGIAVIHRGDQLGFTGMFSDGLGTGQTAWAGPDTDYALTGRVEYLASGNWDQFQDFTNPRGGESGVLAGGAIHYQEGESGTALEGLDVLVLTGDVSVEFDGGNAFATLVYSDLEPAGINPWGFLLQGGWYLNESWEVFGRLEWIDVDVPGVDEPVILTFGVTKYFASHNAKWTTDIAYALETLPAAFGFGPVAITGFRPDPAPPGEDGQWVIRTQWQLFF